MGKKKLFYDSIAYKNKYGEDAILSVQEIWDNILRLEGLVKDKDGAITVLKFRIYKESAPKLIKMLQSAIKEPK